MGELGVILGLAKSTVTGLVDRTERAGLVRREPDLSDSRAIRVALTPHGTEIADGFYTAARGRIEQLQAPLTEAERATLADLLGRAMADNKASALFLD